MQSRTTLWLVAILLIGGVLIGLSQCGYKKLASMSSLENKSAEIEKEFRGVEHISTGTLATLIEAHEKGAVPLLLIDSRSPEEFAISHIPGAVNLESVTDVEKFIKTNLTSEPQTIAVYCSVGYRSAVLVDALNKAGIKHSKNVRGSIFAWANEDRELVGPDGNPVEKVHPYNEFWGRMVKENKRADIPND